MKPCLEKYRGLYVPPDMLEALLTRPYEVDEVCNGVGSKANFVGRATYHLIPDHFLGLDIEPAADVHDWQYSRPTGTIVEKEEADRTFLNNMLRLIDADDSWWGRTVAPIRRHEAKIYYRAVRDFGGPSFWEGKNATYSMAYGISTKRVA